MSYNHVVDWVSNAQENIAALSVKDQVIVYALVVLITILALTVAYWSVKGSLYLSYYAIKGSIYLTYYSILLSLIVPILIIKLLTEYEKKQTQQSITVQESVQIPKYHYCSECGKEFTNGMEEAIHKNGNCFCENCGAKSEIRV